MTRSDPWVLLMQMHEAASRVTSYVQGLSRDEFISSTRTQDAVAMNLLTIGEIASKLARRHPDIVEHYPKLPWAEMRGLRNRIAHDYVSLNMSVVWETATTSLPVIVDELTKMIGENSDGKSPKGLD